MAKRSKQTEDGLIPALRPNDPEALVIGGEPGFTEQPEPHKRTLALIRGFNWYNRFYDSKSSREFFCDYLETTYPDAARSLRSVPENEFIITMGWLARMSLRGLELSDAEKTRIQHEVSRLLDITSPKEKTETRTRVNVQEIMREKAQGVAGEIEGLFDTWVKSGAKYAGEKIDAMRLLHDQNIMPQHVGFIVDQWSRRKTEFESIADDSALAEGYSNFSKMQIRSVIKWCDALIAELGGYVTVKKASKAPRKRKAVPPERQVSKLQYLKKFEELGIQSVAPAKIIGANEVWAYDTEKRKLWYFVADTHAGSLSVKGTTILGFDSASSGMKTIRKPKEQLKEFMAAGKPASRKFFSNIRSVQAALKGRTNSNLLILKVY